MKLVLTPLLEENTLDCNYFTPTYFFDTEWCLDLHGYLTRKQLESRLEEINKIVIENPLLSERAKKGILYGFVGFFVFLMSVIIFGAYTNAVGLTGPSVMEILITIGIFIVRYLINKAAKTRSDKFSKAINEKFKEFNSSDNPVANWSLVWRNVLTHYKVEIKYTADGGMKGKSTPKYAEHAEIVLEINDALSGITKNDVRIKLDELGFYIPRKIDDIDPDENNTSSPIPSNGRLPNSQKMSPSDEKGLPPTPNSQVPSDNNHSCS
ncbi:hypothetical protein C1645_740363 [Glomus cerebriforme]|uniref:Uncharacterized protein n=1 Tax=Glomus cerebriforme TaxID=658196 RepID=A0A397ST24_9GLOM|nr:hypothetical protein C1645_740363 [Glomus cerebriforme]